MIQTTRPTWIEISQSAFFHNIHQYKRSIKNGTLAAVIKSNAYGHDQLTIARLCQKNLQVDWLCVANLSEALFLRQHAITKPILVLSYLDADIVLAAEHAIDIMCYEKEALNLANNAGEFCKKKLNIHLKVDTGVSRFGLMPEEVVPFIQYAQTLPYIHINGIFTHFAQAQHEDQTFTHEQHQKFTALLQELQNQGINIPLRHCANSAATTTLEHTLCNFFRVGAGLYGIWPSQTVQHLTQQRLPDFCLKQVLSWKAIIASIRTIPANTTIGYDRTFTTTQRSKIALLPVGYFEGYDRRLSNSGAILVHNQIAPIIGRVCMNVLIADVTHIGTITAGDHALLIGNNSPITPTELAIQMCSFNPRELLARLHPAIPRIVVE